MSTNMKAALRSKHNQVGLRLFYNANRDQFQFRISSYLKRKKLLEILPLASVESIDCAKLGTYLKNEIIGACRVTKAKHSVKDYEVLSLIRMNEESPDGHCIWDEKTFLETYPSLTSNDYQSVNQKWKDCLSKADEYDAEAFDNLKLSINLKGKTLYFWKKTPKKNTKKIKNKIFFLSKK